MTSNFTQSLVYEENLEINFTINDGIFNTYNQFFILQHNQSIKNITELNSWEHITLNVNENNYFNIEFRTSFNNIDWSNWLTITNDFNNLALNPSSTNFWIQIRYTFITDNNPVIPIELKEFTIYGKRKIDEIFEALPLLPNTPVVYTNQDTYKVFSVSDFILYLKDGNPNDLKIHVRYTQTQGRVWSEWILLTKENLQQLKFERLKFCNFQFSFENTSNVEMKMYDLELIGEFQNITANYKTISKYGLKSQCNPILVPQNEGDCNDSCNTSATCAPCSEAQTPWNPDGGDCGDCDSSKFVQINDRSLWKTQIDLYNQLNSFMYETNSWKCTYFLTDPDKKGIDHILHEQQIHNIISMKDLNIMVPGNQFPVENMMFSGLDLDLIQTFEVHILKDKFKSIFGVEFRPSRRDVIYFCDLNQLWEVEQMFPKRGFMNAEVYYRVMLKKYNDTTSRKFANTDQGQSAKQTIDALTKHTTLDKLFGINEDIEIKKITKNNDVPSILNASQQYTSTTQMDLIKTIHNKTTYISEEIWNASLNIINSYYQFPIKSKNLKFIEYNTTDKILSKGDKRAFTFWFNTEDYDPNYDWTILNNYDYNTNKGYKINIYQGLLSITINNNTYPLVVSNLQNNTWYAMLINVDQVLQNTELAVYHRQSENGQTLPDSKLILLNKIIYENVTPTEFEIDETIFIGGCDTFISTGNTKKWNLTNIRIWNQIIEKNNRNIILNENVVNDSHLTILVDNADKKLKLPKYGNI